MEPDDKTRAQIFTMQIIAAALMFGVVTFLAIAFYIVHARNNAQGMAAVADVPVLSILAGVMLVANTALANIVPGIFVRSQMNQIVDGTWQPQNQSANMDALAGDAAKLMMIRQTSLIVGLALLEGAAFLGCIAYLLEVTPYALGAVVLALGIMITHFPTGSNVMSWIERHEELLRTLREQK